jgi:hyaluronate lyase
VSNPDTAVTKRVVSVVARGSCAFALVPNASEGVLRSYSPLRVVANSPAVQAVEHRGLGLLGVNAFGAGWQRAGWVSVEGPGSVLVRRGTDRTVAVAVSDPTMGREVVSVVLRGSFRVVEADDGVEVRRVAGGTLVRARTWRGYGRTFSAVLR